MDWTFRAPWWLPGGNLQTLWAALVARSHDGDEPRFRRERWTTPDGDFVDVDHAEHARQVFGSGAVPPLLTPLRLDKARVAQQERAIGPRERERRLEERQIAQAREHQDGHQLGQHQRQQRKLVELGRKRVDDLLRLGAQHGIGDHAKLHTATVAQDGDTEADVARLRHPKHALGDA